MILILLRCVLWQEWWWILELTHQTRFSYDSLSSVNWLPSSSSYSAAPKFYWWRKPPDLIILARPNIPKGPDTMTQSSYLGKHWNISNSIITRCVHDNKEFFTVAKWQEWHHPIAITPLGVGHYPYKYHSSDPSPLFLKLQMCWVNLPGDTRHPCLVGQCSMRQTAPPEKPLYSSPGTLSHDHPNAPLRTAPETKIWYDQFVCPE